MATEIVKRVADHALTRRREDQAGVHWGDCVLMSAMLAVAQDTREEAYREYAREWLESYVARGLDPARDVVLNWAGLAGPAAWLYRMAGDERYLAWAEQIAEALLTAAPRLANGGIPPHAARRELWVDIAYFVCPSLAAVSALTGEGRFLDEAVRQVTVHAQHLVDEGSGLFYHVWSEATGQRSPCLWGRGNGWLAISIVEVAEHLEDSHPHKELLLALLRRQVASLAQVQDPCGLWHTVLDRPEAYLETSCSAAFVYVMAKGARLGWLDRRYLGNARLGWLALADRVTFEGRVVGVSAQTPPGDFALYQSIPRGTEKFGTGLFLLAGLEMERL